MKTFKKCKQATLITIGRYSVDFYVMTVIASMTLPLSIFILHI